MSPFAYALVFMTILGLTIPLGGPPLLADHCPPVDESGGGTSVRRGPSGLLSPPAPSETAWPPAPSEEASPRAADEKKPPAAADDTASPASEPGAEDETAPAAADEPGVVDDAVVDEDPAVVDEEAGVEDPAVVDDDAGADDHATDDAAAAGTDPTTGEDQPQPADAAQQQPPAEAPATDPASPAGQDDAMEISGRSVPITLAQSVEACPTLSAPEWVRPNRTITVDAAGFLPPATEPVQTLSDSIGGNPRGADGRSSCDDGHVTGVRADVVYPWWSVETGGVIGRIAAVCGEVEQGFIGTASDRQADQYSTCPADHVVVGLDGYEGDLVDGVSVRCQALDASGRPTGDVTTGSHVGGTGGGRLAEPLACPADAAATGLHGLESDLLTSVGLVCTTAPGTPADIVVEVCRDGSCDWWTGEVPFTVITADEQAAGVTDGQVDIYVPWYDDGQRQRTPLGTYELRATAADGSVATTTIEVVEPEAHAGLVSTLDLAAEMVRPAGFIAVTGSYFDPGVPVEVLVECYVPRSEAYPFVSAMDTPDASGQVEARLRLPADVPAEADCWTYVAAPDESSSAVADETFFVREPNPAVVATPAPVVEGSTFVLNGTDFAPEADVTVSFTRCDGCDELPEPSVARSDADGSVVTAALPVPDGAPTLLGVQLENEFGDTVETLVPVQALPPALIVPSAARSGGQVRVAGRHFPRGRGESVLADIDLAVDCGGAVVRPRPGRVYKKKVALVARQFDGAVLDVPETDAEACQVVATAPQPTLPPGDPTGGELRAAMLQSVESVVLATAPLAVTQGDPRLVIDPETVAAGDQLTVSGVDFVPGEQVVLGYQWPTGTVSADVVADEAGSFTHDTTAPAGAAGQVAVTAVGDRGSDVSNTVGVQPQQFADPPPPSSPSPSPSPSSSPLPAPPSTAPLPPPVQPTIVPTARPTSVATPPASPPASPPALPKEPEIIDPLDPPVPPAPINPQPSDRPLVVDLPAVDDVADDDGDTDLSGATEESPQPPDEDAAPLPPDGGPDAGGDTPDPGDEGVTDSSATEDEQPAAGGRARSRFTQAVPLPSSSLLNTELLGQNALIAMVLILFMLFSGELFNATYEEHADEVNGWFGPFTRAAQRLAAAFSGPAARAGGMVVFLAVTGIIGSLLDPEFGFDRASIALLLGITAGLVVITAVYYLSYSFYMRRTYGEPVRVQAIPGGILVALACVAISRAIDFEPGYLYGVIAGIALQRELTVREEGKVVAITALGLLVASVASWLAWGPVVAAASAANPGLGVLVLDATLASVFVAGVEILAFSLLPMRFLDGPKLKAFNPYVWLGFLGVGMFGFVHVLLHPDTGMQGQGSLNVVIALFAGFAVFSVAFWAYFRYRKPRTQPV